MENFQVGKPVQGTEFIGREQEINQLKTLVKSGQSIVLIAPRRFGKTSLILQVLEGLKAEGCDTCFTDIFTTPDIKKLSETLTSNILENHKLGKLVTMSKKNVGELFRNIELKSEIENFEFILKFGQQGIDEWKLLEESIDFAEKFAEKYQRRLVIGLDEFGDIEKLGGIELAKLLRAKMQIQKNVSYLFSGSYESVINQLFTTAKSPFYRFARIIQLGPIQKKDFKNLFDKKLKEAGLEINQSLTEKILSFTNGHPYYSSLFLQQWLLMSDFLPKKPEEAFQFLTDQILLIEKAYLEKLWEDVSSGKDQRNLILALAESQKPYSALDVKRINISRTITKLKNKGIIMKKQDGYSFTDPVFEIWVQREVLKIIDL